MRLLGHSVTVLPQWIIRIRAGLLDRVEAWAVRRRVRRIFDETMTEMVAEKMAADIEDEFLNGTGAEPFDFLGPPK